MEPLAFEDLTQKALLLRSAPIIYVPTYDPDFSRLRSLRVIS